MVDWWASIGSNHSNNWQLFIREYWNIFFKKYRIFCIIPVLIINYWFSIDFKVFFSSYEEIGVCRIDSFHWSVVYYRWTNSKWLNWCFFHFGIHWFVIAVNFHLKKKFRIDSNSAMIILWFEWIDRVIVNSVKMKSVDLNWNILQYFNPFEWITHSNWIDSNYAKFPTFQLNEMGLADEMNRLTVVVDENKVELIEGK